MVNDLYIAKNKYIEKGVKEYRVWYKLFGESILLTKSNDFWQTKRKHLSAAFYKDKMTQML